MNRIIFILAIVTAFFFGDIHGCLGGYRTGERNLLNKLANYRPSHYFDHPGLLTEDEKARMDNAYLEILREVSK